MRTNPASMYGAKISSNTGRSGSVIGLSFSATTWLCAWSAYRTSSAAMEKMFPAPRTAQTPLVRCGLCCPSPAWARTVAASTPGVVHTCAVYPFSSSRSKTSCGRTSTADRPPGAALIR
jgi:hypothetical protein